jgi:hypothetical protein
MKEQLEAQLDQLHRTADAIQSNLVEFELEVGRQLIDPGSLTGESGRVAEQITAATSDLWQRHTLLTDLIARADKARAARRWDELNELLNSTSIELPRTELPLAQRGLLSGSEAAPRCSARELQRAMSTDFETVKAALQRFVTAWDELAPPLDEATRTAATCRELAAELGGQTPDDVAALEAELSALSAHMGSDPLSVPRSELTALCARVVDIRRDLEAATALKRGLDARFAGVRSIVADLRAALSDRDAARSELVAKIAASPPGPTAPPVHERELDAQLEGISQLAEQGRWREAAGALDGFGSYARELLESLRQATREYRAPIESRNQFRALLDAYRAKAAARGLIEDPQLAGLYDAAHDALYTAPTDLAAAGSLVRRYQARVNGTEITQGKETPR